MLVNDRVIGRNNDLRVDAFGVEACATNRYDSVAAAGDATKQTFVGYLADDVVVADPRSVLRG